MDRNAARLGPPETGHLPRQVRKLEGSGLDQVANSLVVHEVEGDPAHRPELGLAFSAKFR